jgi:hypothetical protein
MSDTFPGGCMSDTFPGGCMSDTFPGGCMSEIHSDGPSLWACSWPARLICNLLGSALLVPWALIFKSRDEVAAEINGANTTRMNGPSKTGIRHDLALHLAVAIAVLTRLDTFPDPPPSKVVTETQMPIHSESSMHPLHLSPSILQFPPDLHLLYRSLHIASSRPTLKVWYFRGILRIFRPASTSILACGTRYVTARHPVELQDTPLNCICAALRRAGGGDLASLGGEEIAFNITSTPWTRCMSGMRDRSKDRGRRGRRPRFSRRLIRVERLRRSLSEVEWSIRTLF